MSQCLIPAAGFGKRVGSPRAKELLLVDGKPLIDWSLELALSLGLEPVVITRSAKTELVEYLKTWHSRGVRTLLIEGSREWPESVALSSSLWSEVNVLLLPDTRFASPRELVRDLVGDCVAGADASFATFAASDYRTWGVVDLADRFVRMCEKPLDRCSPSTCAWGLIAFRRGFGETLFARLLESCLQHTWFEIEGNFRARELLEFRDVTR